MPCSQRAEAAEKRGEKVDANRELIGLGAANLESGLRGLPLLPANHARPSII